MSGADFDAILRAAVAESAQIQVDGLIAQVEGQPDHRFSKRFQRRMTKLLKAPLLYARAPWQRVLRTAAMVLITLGLTGAVLLSIPQVRATVWNFIRTVYETHTEYRFTEPAPEEPVPLPTYHANWLPEGYEETMVRNTGSVVLIQYQNETGSMIVLRYSAAIEGHAFSVDNEHTTEETITLNGTTYTSFFNEETGWRSLTWFSEDCSVFYQLDGCCTTEELLKIKDNLS